MLQPHPQNATLTHRAFPGPSELGPGASLDPSRSWVAFGCLAAVILLLAVFHASAPEAQGWGSYRTGLSAAFVWGGIGQQAIALGLGIALLRRGRVMWSVFTLSQLIVPATVFIFQCLSGVPFSNWREQAISPEEAASTVVMLNGYLGIMNLFSLWEIRGREVVRAVPMRSLQLTSLGVIGLWVIGLGASAALLAYSGKSRDEFTLESGVGDRFVVRFAIVAATFAFAVGLHVKNMALRPLPWVMALLALFMCVLGFRYLAFTLLILGVVARLAAAPPSLKFILAMLLLAPAAYMFLIISAYTRQQGGSPFEAMASVATGKVPLEDIFAYAGGNEQCAFFTFKFVRDQTFFLNGEYYAISLVRLLPQPIYLRLTDQADLSIGHYIARQCAPDAFLEAGLTLGGYFHAEAWVNFGRVGPYIALTVSYLAVRLMEWLRHNVPASRMLYVAATGSMFLFVLYGIENYLKPLLLFAIFTCMFVPLMRSGSDKKASTRKKEAETRDKRRMPRIPTAPVAVFPSAGKGA